MNCLHEGRLAVCIHEYPLILCASFTNAAKAFCMVYISIQLAHTVSTVCPYCTYPIKMQPFGTLCFDWLKLHFKRCLHCKSSGGSSSRFNHKLKAHLTLLVECMFALATLTANLLMDFA